MIVELFVAVVVPKELATTGVPGSVLIKLELYAAGGTTGT